MRSTIKLTATLTIILTVLSMAMPAGAQSARLRTDPLSLGIKPGAEATWAIVFEYVQDLYMLEVHLAFDPQVVQVIDANPAIDGVQVAPAAWLKDAFIAVNKVDNLSGRIDFAATLLNPAQPVSGSKPVITLNVQGMNEGTTLLSITDAILANRDGMQISSEIQPGILGVSSSGKAPDASLLGLPPGTAIAPVSPDGTEVEPSLILMTVIGLGALILVLAFVVSAINLRQRPAQAYRNRKGR